MEVAVSDATVEQVCEKFLQHEHARLHHGEISASQFEKTRCGIQQLAEFIGPVKKFASVTELDLDDYSTYTTQRQSRRFPIDQRVVLRRADIARNTVT